MNYVYTHALRDANFKPLKQNKTEIRNPISKNILNDILEYYKTSSHLIKCMCSTMCFMVFNHDCESWLFSSEIFVKLNN